MSTTVTKNKRKVFLENFFSLSVLQFVSNALPIITIPYLTRTIGLEGFGIYVFIQALINFLDILVSYGFRVSATDEIAKNSENMVAVSRIFWTVVFTKICLLVCTILLLLIGIVFIPVLSNNSHLIFLGMPLLLGNLLFPVWLFQGLQNMKFITILHLVSKSFFVVTIFLFVKDSSDIGTAILLHASGVLIAGFLSLLVAIREFDLKFYAPNLKGITSQLRNGRDIFFAQLMVSFYTTINIIVLGLFHPGAIVAAYALGDKVFRLVGSLSAPFNRAIFPILSTQYTHDKTDYLVIARKSIIALFLVFSVLGVAVYFLAQWIILVLAGGDIQKSDSETILKILAVAIPFFVVAAASTYHLVTQEKSSLLLKILVFSAVVNVILIFPVSFLYEALGVAYLTLGIAIAIAVAQTVAMFHVSNKS